MENLIPILIGLIILGYKQYQKNKTKQSPVIPPPVPEENETDALTIDDLMNAFFRSPKKEEFSTPAFDTISDQEEEENDWMEEMHAQEPESIEYMDTKSRINKPSGQFEMIQNKPGETRETLDFDLRKAVIYDAIMNPPYL